MFHTFSSTGRTLSSGTSGSLRRSRNVRGSNSVMIQLRAGFRVRLGSSIIIFFLSPNGPRPFSTRNVEVLLLRMESPTSSFGKCTELRQRPLCLLLLPMARTKVMSCCDCMNYPHEHWQYLRKL